jgi:hypothetical protein
MKKLPTDKEVHKWFDENIGVNNNCSASSAIYKFRLWLNEREQKPKFKNGKLHVIKSVCGSTEADTKAWCCGCQVKHKCELYKQTCC